jgi:hypothetical protein
MWNIYDYIKGLILEHQPHVLQVGEKVIVEGLDKECTYEITKTYIYTVTVVNVETGVHLTVHISDILMVQ